MPPKRITHFTYEGNLLPHREWEPTVNEINGVMVTTYEVLFNGKWCTVFMDPKGPEGPFFYPLNGEDKRHYIKPSTKPIPSPKLLAKRVPDWSWLVGDM